MTTALAILATAILATAILATAILATLLVRQHRKTRAAQEVALEAITERDEARCITAAAKIELATTRREALARVIDHTAFEDHPIEKRQPGAALQWSVRRKWALDAADAVLAAGYRLTGTGGTRVEWAVRHSQGIHPGPFTEQSAREWMGRDIKGDERRRPEARGKTLLLRRTVTDWQEVPADE